MRRLAVVLIVMLTAAVFVAAGGGAAAARVAPCRSAVHEAVVPPWARAGFSDKRPRMPLSISRRGMVAALVFGDPLTAPPRRDVGNKVLWVAHHPRDVMNPADLRISAQRMRGTRAVGRPTRWTVAGGPGPSTDDVPVAGCWRLTLRWGRQTDQIDLAYARPASR